MGAYSPVSVAGPSLLERVKRDIFAPTLEELQRMRTPFSGVLYAGLMIDAQGLPWVIEFNCRLGDPEAQVVLPLISQGLTECLARVAGGKSPSRINSSRGAAVTTVLASLGYPEHPALGAPITLPDSIPANVFLFQGGTTRGADNQLQVSGGRVLAATGVAPSFTEAQRLSRAAAESIQFEGKVFRGDIGWREAARLETRRMAGAPQA
jgi:phosphoribosylamine--glycine ligase